MDETSSPAASRPAAVALTPAARTRVFLALLFASGFTSLVYQVLWNRMLLGTFGATVYASGTVLTAFMGGLALGSWGAGRLVDRSRPSPLRIYAGLELGIGLFALVFPWLLEAITAAHVWVFRSVSGSFTTFTLVRFALAFAALLVPATLMGATLPAITRHGVPEMAHLGRDFGRVYAMNTLGAALGTFLTGYLFIELFGIRTTTWIAAAVNVAIFAAAMALARDLEKSAGAETAAARPAAEPAARRSPKPERVEKRKRKGAGAAAAGAPAAGAPGAVRALPSEGDRRLALAAIAISGFAALAYEVLWARTLVYILGNFVQSFSTMLASFLVGIALGSWALGRRADRIARPAMTFAAFQAIIAVSTLVLLPIFPHLVLWREAVLESLASTGTIEEYRDPWLAFTAWKTAVTFVLLLVPTFFMGASFPLAIRLFVPDRERLGRGVGIVYAANTFGAILGAFAASFVLVPWIGLRSSVLAAAGANLLAAALLASRHRGRFPARRTALAAGAAIAVLALAAAASSPTNFHPVFESAEAGKRLIYVDEAVSGTVTIHESPSGYRVIDINGLNVAGTKFGFNCTQKLQAHLPLLVHPAPANVLQIGFGTGGTCYSVSTHPEVRRIDCVEINRAVIDAAPYFLDRNQEVLRDPRVGVTIEDARNFVLSTDRRYDVILSDSIHPRFTGNGLLYTADYYDLCARTLAEGGIVSTWLPTGFIGEEEFRIIIRSMRSALPHVLVWYMNNTVEGYTIVMGSRTPFRIDFDALSRRMSVPSVQADLAAVHVENPYDLLDFIAVGGEAMRGYVGEGALNTEDRPVIEFRSPRNMSRLYTEFRNLQRILEHRNFPATSIDWGADPTAAAERRTALARYFEATSHVLQAQQLHLFGRLEEERAHLARAIEINPEDRDAPYLAERAARIAAGERVDW